MTKIKFTGSITLKNPNVQKIIDIAKELIEENKVLRVKNLYDRAIKCLKIPGGVLLEIINFLINKKILIDGSKLTRDIILLNLYRKKIYTLIYKYNGATFSFLREKAFKNQSSSSGQLLWHLGMLLKFEFIKKIKIGNYTMFLPVDMDDYSGTLYFYMKDNLYKKIIELLLNNEKNRKPDIYKKINVKRENVNYRLRVLLDNHILLYKDKKTKEICISSRARTILSHYIKKIN